MRIAVQIEGALEFVHALSSSAKGGFIGAVHQVTSGRIILIKMKALIMARMRAPSKRVLAFI